MKKLFVSLLLLTSSLSFAFALSFTVAATQPGDIAPDQSSAVVCTDLTYNLTYKKSKDSNTDGQVSDLQNFLQDQELLSSDPTGYYGALTFQAVKAFQTKSGLLASGYVGPLTRTKIKEWTCPGSPIMIDYLDPLYDKVATSSGVKINVLSPVGEEAYSVGQMVPFSWTVDNIEKVMPASGSGLWMGAYLENTWTGKRVFLGDAMLPLKVGSSERVIPATSDGAPMVPGYYRIRLYLYGLQGESAAGYSKPFKVSSATATSTPTMGDDVFGQYTIYKNDVIVESSGSSETSALAACKKYVSPTIHLKCVWSERVLYESFPLPDSEMNPLKVSLSPSGKTVTASEKVTITWGSSEEVTGAKASLWLKNLTTGTLKLIKSGLVTTGSHVLTLPAKGATVSCPDCGGIQAELTSGTYAVVVKTYTPSNAWLGSGYPQANPVLPTYIATNETGAFVYGKIITEPSVAAYNGYMNGSLFTTVASISKEEALSNCKINSSSNPSSSVRCTWNGVEIYSFTPTSMPVSATTITTTSRSLVLGYDTTGSNESKLTAKFYVNVTAGNKSLTINKPTSNYSATLGMFGVNLLKSDGQGDANIYNTPIEVVQQGSNIIDNGTYWTVPAGQTGGFVITRSYNPKSLFAGSYYAKLSFSTGGEGLSVSNGSTNAITVVGETSPYIASATTDASGSIVLTGARLNLPDNYIQINGQGNSLVSKFNPTATRVTINPSAYELTAGGHTIQITNTKTGNSNSVYVQVSVVPPILPTPATGVYKGYMNGMLFITTYDITLVEAQSNCILSANSNPRSSVRCTWNDVEIYTTSVSGTTGTTTLLSSRTAGFVAYSVSPNTSGVKIGSFTVQGPASGQATLKNFYVTLSPSYPGLTYQLSNLSNLTLKVGGSGIGVPIGNPKADGNLFSASDIAIPSGTTKTIDIYADIGTTPGSVTASLNAYGTSPQGAYVVGITNGVPVTSVAATLANPTLVSSSPVSQYVVGGTTFGIATYKLATAVSGTQAIVRELRFRSTGLDAIESITVAGVTASVISGGVTTISGLSIPIASSGTAVPVMVKFSGFQNSTTGGSLQTGIANVGITLSYVEAISGGGSVLTNSTSVASPVVTLVGSKPTVTTSTEKGNALMLGSENKIGEFTVSADANGKIALLYASLTVSTSEVSNFKLSSARLTDGVTTVSGSQVGISGNVITLSFGQYEISAGQSKTFSVHAVISGQSNGVNAPVLTSRFTSSSSFVWLDRIGGNLQLTGEKIYNFPTSSWSTIQGFPTMGDDIFGMFVVYKNNVMVESSGSSETSAHAACKKYVSPTIHLKCTWGDKVIYESFPLPDYDINLNPTPTPPTPIPTPPVLNKFSPKCSVPGYTGLAAGTEVCYGMWDYGDALGGDVDMCGGYSAANTGCVVSAPACASGKAEAVKYYSAPGMSQAVLQYAANNLNVTPTFLQQNMVMLWVYNCKGDTSTLNMSTVSGQVLGASTMCVDLPFDFHRGNQSPSTKKLQDFLIKKGYMEGEVTGFYGDSTVAAVKDYQKGKGLPQTGMMYEFTRSTLKKETCQ